MSKHGNPILVSYAKLCEYDPSFMPKHGNLIKVCYVGTSQSYQWTHHNHTHKCILNNHTIMNYFMAYDYLSISFTTSVNHQCNIIRQQPENVETL